METLQRVFREHPYLSYTLAGGAVAIAAWKFATRRRYCSESVQLKAEYDYVIVGSGSSGAVLANRLSEDPNVSVLLLEAGGPDNNMMSLIPLAAPLLQKTSYDWQFQTVPQKDSHWCYNSNRSNWPRGRVLGGSSVINWMLYVRGNPWDYDSWGLPGWSFKELLPSFLRSENCTVSALNDSPFHQKGGPLPVSLAPSPNLLSRLFVKGCQQVGIPELDDYNTPDQIGAAMAQSCTKDGQRWSTNRAFLQPIWNRRNLTIATSAQVVQITFNQEGKVPYATGVIGHRGKKGHVTPEHPKFEVRAKREVILSAGAVGSPHLLLLSGIGPRETMNKHKLPFVHHLAYVGKNLQDHMMVPVLWESYTPTTTEKDGGLANLLRQKVLGNGPMASSGLDSIAFFRTGLHPEMAAPDVQIHCVAAGSSRSGGNLNWNLDRITARQDVQYQFAMLPTLLHPKSVGTISLHNGDPFAKPLIDPCYFSDKDGDDVKTLVAGIEKCLEIAASPVLSPHLSRLLSTETIKGCPLDWKKDGKAFWEHYVRSLSCTVYHPVGTCKMGREDDESAVVDTQLRVRGVGRLRVVDASVMPTVPSANTHAPSIMIGEKAAEMIKTGSEFCSRVP